MKLNERQINDIIAKQETLEQIKPILKNEFKGIDGVIDNLIDSIRPFVVFPKSLKRPLIINLWGMTGSGKTSLVNRLVQLLEMSHQYCKFDIGEYASNGTDWKLRSDLSDKADKCLDKHLIVVFDEFQLGRTIDEHGKEIDRSTLRPAWDIIDSGIIHKFARRTFDAVDIATKLRKCLDAGVVIDNGVVVQNEEIYNTVFRYSTLRKIDFLEYGNITDDGPPTEVDPDDFDEVVTETLSGFGPEYAIVSGTQAHNLRKPYFIKYEQFLQLFNSNPDFFGNIQDFNKWKSLFRDGKSGEQLLQFLYENFIAVSPLMLKEDYSQSLVFCIGNVDEAYEMTHSADPDDDPDLLHEYSLKITVPQIKEALSRRYRMEQISRLGNNHIIYPSFNRQAYQEIIELNLQSRVKYFNDEFGVELIFDDSMKDILYKESVFPTQGARPVMSSFLTLIDSYVALIISDIVLKIPQTNKLEWSFDLKDLCYYIKATDDGNKSAMLTYPVKLNIERLRQSDFSELQTTVAVHEAGHAVLSIIVDKLVPKEVKSRTASMAEGTTRVEQTDIVTKKSLMNMMIIGLGGMEAEKMIFGPELQMAGSVGDLQTVTGIAAKIVKTYGMDNHVHQISTATAGPNAIYDTAHNQEAESKAIELVAEAQEKARKMLEENLSFLLELSMFLSVNASIDEDALRQMSAKYIDVSELKTKETYYDFKKMLENQYNLQQRS